jgi:microcystin-dependent protein
MGLWPKFDLLAIKTMVADTPPEYHLLSGSSVLLALDGLSRFPEIRSLWVNDGDPVTDAQWDEVQAMIDLAQEQLIEALMIGTILPFAGELSPGFLLCDGSAVSRETYNLLFGVIGEVYGPGDSSTTFNLPDLRGRVMAGRDESQTEFTDLGQSGGEKEHTLTTDEIPSHAHSEGTVMATLINGGVEAPAPAALPSVGYTGYAGGGGAHNNLQPYVVLQFGIKS